MGKGHETTHNRANINKKQIENVHLVTLNKGRSETAVENFSYYQVSKNDFFA